MSSESPSRPLGRPPATSRVTQLGYLGIEVADVERWEEFATEVLGAAVSDRADDGSFFLRVDERHHRIAVRPGPADGLCLLGWQVADAADLAAVAGRLVDAGYEVEAGSPSLARERRVVDLIALRDPDGLRLEVFHGPLEPDERFRSPRPMSGPFRTGALGLGHIAGTVGDADAAIHLYCDLLGFEVSDYVDATGAFPGGGWIYFLRCNPRHHSIAFGASAAEPRMHHLLLEVAELDDVGRTLDLLEERRIAVTQTLGKHNNDHMVSVYFQSPSRFEVEYGWGGRLLEAGVAHPAVLRTPTDLWGHRRTFPGSDG